MNILYLGPYRQANDGWAVASLNFLLSLLKTEHTVHCRPVYLANTSAENIPFEILSHEIPSSIPTDYSVCIQQCLPPYFEPRGEFGRNIGMVFTETSHLQNTDWVRRINLMDDLIVSSEVERQNLLVSGVTIPIHILPVPCDISKFDRTFPPIFDKKGQFLFYYTGDYIQRKNVIAALMAFHLEFQPYENVNFLLKLNRGSLNPQDLLNTVKRDISDLKKTMRLYPNEASYKQEMVITDFLSDDGVSSIHSSCDCFVCSSHGEAFSIPTFEAMGFGKTPIVTDGTGMCEFIINVETGFTVPSVESPVFTTDVPFPELYTGREKWRNIHIDSLRKIMRQVYDANISKSTKLEEIRNKGRQMVKNYSYQSVAEKINLILEAK